jgi:hypothetical protein
MNIANIRAVTVADESGDRLGAAFEGLIVDELAALHDPDPAVQAAAEQTLGAALGAAIRQSTIGATP